LDLLSRGALHLSALMLIGPHLTDANHQEWLNAVAGKSKRDVELFVATRCPDSIGGQVTRRAGKLRIEGALRTARGSDLPVGRSPAGVSSRRAACQKRTRLWQDHAEILKSDFPTI
jgi:hypothetical protein